MRVGHKGQERGLICKSEPEARARWHEWEGLPAEGRGETHLCRQSFHTPGSLLGGEHGANPLLTLSGPKAGV